MRDELIPQWFHDVDLVADLAGLDAAVCHIREMQEKLDRSAQQAVEMFRRILPSEDQLARVRDIVESMRRAMEVMAMPLELPSMPAVYFLAGPRVLEAWSTPDEPEPLPGSPGRLAGFERDQYEPRQPHRRGRTVFE